MTGEPHVRWFKPGDRLFPVLSNLFVFMDMEIYAFCAMKGLPIQKPTGRHGATMLSKMHPLHMTYPVFGPYHATYNNIPFLGFESRLFEAEPPADLVLFPSKEAGAVMHMVWSMAFVFFHEQHRPWIECKYGTTQQQRNDEWPEIFRFASVLRNAAAHHGGRLNMKDHIKPVVWMHLRYDHNNNGLKVFGDVMSVADMLMFLIAMSDELDRRGCPLDPQGSG